MPSKFFEVLGNQLKSRLLQTKDKKMVKKLTMLLPVLVILGFVSAAPANANWFTHAFHSATHAISHAAKSVAHGVEHDAKAIAKDAKVASKVFGRVAKEAANKACKKLLPGVLKIAIGKACKVAALEVSGACNAALDAETAGMGSIACDASGVVLYAECKHTGKMLTSMVRPITDKACNKI
jgi:hypothetical protein